MTSTSSLSDQVGLGSIASRVPLRRRRDEEARLTARARAWLESSQRAEGIHASDLLMPRRGFWRLTAPLPLTDREVGLFVVGRVLHALVLGTPGLAADEGERYDQELGLWYSPDAILADGAVLELKTHRGLREPERTGELATYVHQLLIYLACLGARRGVIAVLYTNLRHEGRTHPQIRCYEVRVRRPEVLRRLVQQDVARLRAALTSGDHRSLPLCPEWICRPGACGWWERCQPEGRYAPLEPVAEPAETAG